MERIAAYLVAMRYGNPLVFSLATAHSSLRDACTEADLRANETGRTHVVYSLWLDGETRPVILYQTD